MSKKYIYILRGELHIYPPCVSQIQMLSKHVDDVIVLCSSCDNDVINDLKKDKIKVITFGDKRISKGFFGKLTSYMFFRYKVLKFLEYEDKENTILWFGTTDSSISLYGVLNGWEYIVNSLELYDNNLLYRKGLSLVVKKARCLVVCEYNRACIMKSWWNLKNTPYVMPNKPYKHPQLVRMNSDDNKITSVIEQIKSTKVIIYQGLIMWSFLHLETIAKALAEMNENYSLVLLGNNDNKIYESIKHIYSKTINVGYIPAPKHLIITSYAHLGIATYDEKTLNNLYCAPNKIYEYAGFGIPMICNDIPGLRYTIGYNKAGICTDLGDVECVKSAIREIDSKYNIYSLNSKSFFDNTDNNLIIKNIISSEKKNI